MDHSKELNKNGKYTGQGPVYIINVTAFVYENDAIKKVSWYRKAGYQAGYLWIPDYPSLSGKRLFVVFLGPYYSQKSCELATENYKKVWPDAYGVLVSMENKRVEIRGIGKVKVINNYR